MKFLPAQLAYLLSVRETRRSVITLARYVGFLLLVIAAFAVLFHVIMDSVEDRQYSWITGFYWTLTVMTTLGFGDITFASDTGRLFSIIVMLTGVVLLLIVLPFAFIRLFFAPWLEAQMRFRAPREVPEDTADHVIIAGWDAIAPGLVRRLRAHGIAHFVIEPDPVAAAHLQAEGVSVIAGEVDARETYEHMRAASARLLIANRADVINTNIVLTAREAAPDLGIVALADDEDSIDVLELSGANHVLAIKRQLGELLVQRINAGHAQSHVVGRFHDLLVAEFPVHNTALVGRTIRDTRLREVIGVNFIGVWERGRLLPALPDTELTQTSVPVVIGTPAQIEEIDALLVIYDTNYSPALVIGGGKVGRAAVRELRRRDFPVHLVERDPRVCDALRSIATDVFTGDAADREVLERAGISAAPSVLLTTNDDAMNIYLAIYCRRLNPDLRIVSRITHERNLEAIHRAGADFVLSYASLGAEHLFALVQGRELILLGEQIELLSVTLPASLVDRALAESGIGDQIGMNVIAIQVEGEIVANPRGDTRLPAGAELLMLGTAEQLERFRKHFGSA